MWPTTLTSVSFSHRWQTADDRKHEQTDRGVVKQAHRHFPPDGGSFDKTAAGGMRFASYGEVCALVLHK
jgi:hypothetical protein